MSEFTELLGEIIKEGNLTVYGLAKECDVDRSLLQKVISEGRKINYDSFMRIFEVLKNVADAKRIRELYEKFSEEHYGSKEMYIIRYIKQRMEEMRNNEEVINKYRELYMDKNIGISVEECIEEEYNNYQKDILKEVYNLIYEEFKIADMNNRKPRIWARFPSDWKFLRKLILYCINLSKYPENIDFLYCLTGVKKSEDRDLKLLENYFTACEFAQYGFNSCSGLDEKKDSYFELIPYYVITGEKVFVIFQDGSFSINSEEDVVNKMTSSFYKIVSEEEYFMKEIHSDLFSFVSVQESCKQNNTIENICNDIDISFYYDKEIMSEIIPQDKEEREGLVYIMSFYNENLRHENRRINFTMDSVLKLMNDENKSKWIHSSKVSKEKKLQILSSIISEVNDSKVELSMILADKFKYHSKLNIRLISERMISCEGKIFIGEKLQEGMSFLISPLINRHLRNYNQYIKNSELCLSPGQSKKIFEMLVRGLYKG